MFKKVTLSVKAVDVKEAVELKEKVKQDVFIADVTATAKVTLREEHVGSLIQGSSNLLEQFVMHVYQSKKYVFVKRGRFRVSYIETLAHCVETSIDEEVTLHNVTVIGVPELDSYKTCMKCKVRVEPSLPTWGSCSKLGCKML